MVEIQHWQESGFKCDDLVRFMQSIDHRFSPPLGSFVDIPGYCHKLESLAEIYVAIRQNNIVGVMAMYCNDMKTRIAHPTYLGVADELTGQGIGKALLLNAIEIAHAAHMKEIKMRTWEHNEAALTLYQRMGFKVIATRADRADGSNSIWLRLPLESVVTPGL